MKHTAKLSVLLALSFGLFVAQSAYAQVTNEVIVESNGSGSSSSVNINNSVNSNSESTSKTTVKNHVCIESNGKKECYDSDKEENIDMQSDDGNTRVRINNSESTTTIIPEPTKEAEAEENEVTPTITPTPTIAVKVEDAQKKAEEVKKKAQEVRKEVKLRLKNNDAFLSSFLKTELQSFQKLLNNLFS